MDTRLEAQRGRLLDALRSGPVSALYAVIELDILRPAARVFELRADGYPIHTHWRVDTINGQQHRVASYVLLTGDSND